MPPIKLRSEIHPLDVQVDLASTMPAGDLLSSVLEYNWDMYPADVLSVIAERGDCSLLTALEIFCSAEPEYYEYQENCGDPAILAMLHNIHDRVNMGAYVHNPRDHLSGIGLVRIKSFLAPRETATSDRHRVLWQFDPNIVLPALSAPEEIIAEKERRKLAPTDTEKAVAESHAIAIFTKSGRAKSAQMAVDMSNRKIQRHVSELLADPARIRALIEERQAKPDTLNLPPKSHALAIRLSELSNIEIEQDLLRKFNPFSDGSAVADWRNFGATYWHAGFEIEDMVKEFGDHPDLVLSSYQARLTEKYAPPGDYHSRFTYFVRKPQGALEKALNKILGRKQDKDSLWARYVFDDTMMFVGLSDYLTGSAELAEKIEAAAPISEELKRHREAYKQSTETFEKKLRVAKKFRTEIIKFLDEDIDALAWENRPRWSQYRQHVSLS